MRTKGFNWSEVHLYRSSFLQNHTLGIDGKSTLSEKETSMITVLPNVTYFVKLPSFFFLGGGGAFWHFWQDPSLGCQATLDTLLSSAVSHSIDDFYVLWPFSHQDFLRSGI